MATMKHTSLLLFALLVTGCATSPVTVSESHTVPPARLLTGYSALAQLSPSRAAVTVIRDAGLYGSGEPARPSVDGSPVARLWSRERVEFYVSPGDHIFAVVPEPQFLAGLVERSYSFVAGRHYYFRISISESGFTIQPSTQLR